MVSGSVLNKVFSSDVDDEIYSTLQFANGAYGQLATNWSDESYRKMSVKVSIWGTNGRINVTARSCRSTFARCPSPARAWCPAGITLHHGADAAGMVLRQR